jgi:hypothetical protein
MQDFQPKFLEDTHMVKQSKTDPLQRQGKWRRPDPFVITASTPHEYIDEFFSPFGGLLAFVKMFEALRVKDLFDEHFVKPARTPEKGHYFMFTGLLFLLITGFQRLYHFSYIAQDPMLLGILGVSDLPVVSTFWRWLKSCGINQANSLVKLIAVVRERVWSQVGYCFETIHIDIDTTVKTVYGEIEGARKGHNRQYRGKKGLRPILSFCAETKEYIFGKLRRGTTVSGKDTKKFIKAIRPLLPGCVQNVIIRADSELFSEVAVTSCEEENYSYIIASKKTAPDFDPERWYSLRKHPEIQYNSCEYRPTSWKKPQRFVAMRILKKDAEHLDGKQADLFEDADYKYRIFVNDRKGRPHKIIDEYDGRAAAEPLIGEAKREGLNAIPSKRFLKNMVFFQLVMLVYNLWRHMQAFVDAEERSNFRQHTVHVARLKMLFLAAKITRHGRQEKIKYSRFLDFRPQLEKLFQKLDELIRSSEIWDHPISWAST